MSHQTEVDLALFADLIPLNALTPENQRTLAKSAVIVSAHAGDYLFRVGEPATQALFLLDGELVLETADGKSAQRLRGGEREACHRIAHHSPRRVAAHCMTPVRYLAIDAGLLDVMLTWEQTGTLEVNELGDGNARSDGDDWMMRLLQMRIFQRVPPTNLQAMFMRMEQLQAEPGQVIVRQGEDGDFFYAIMQGRCLVTREVPGQKPIRLAELDAGSCFGEEALIADVQRNATVTMLTRGSLMRLSKDDFRTLLNEPLARRLSFEDATALVDQGKARWLDVRLPSEHQNQHIPGSLNMPLYLLRMKLGTLDKQLAYITYCDSGRRSAAASFVLTNKGFDAYMLDQGTPPPQ